MRETENLKLKMPEKNEYINIADINENTEKIDNELAKKADASGGDISETVITTVEASQAEYPVPAAGDSAKAVLGKVQKFFADIRNWMTGVCLLGQIVNNCVTDNAKLPLSAAQGKVLMDLYNVLNTKNQNAIYSTFGSATFTIPANSTMTVEVPYTVPSGYKKITLIDKGVGDARCYVADWSAGTGNSAILKIANTSNSQIATSASIRFLCCKS